MAHLAGCLTRLFTYARGEALSPDLQKALEAERRIAEARPAVGHLLELLAGALDAAFQELERVPPASLWDRREVGRARLPSTTWGLLFHGADHTARHAGQIATLAPVLPAPAARPGDEL